MTSILLNYLSTFWGEAQMATPNFPYEVQRRQDLLSVDVQLRDRKDLFITCPPLSGLSTFLRQIEKHVLVSDHFRETNTLIFDCGTQNNLKNLAGSISLFVYNKLEIEQLSRKFHNKRKNNLLFVLEAGAKQNESQKYVIIIDNLEKAPQDEAVSLLENVRVIAERRSINPYLRNTVFILAGHSLNLRKLDPKHSSPFNIATQVYLDDLPFEDSIMFIREALAHNKLSPLIVEYIDFLTYGHPYLISQICYQLSSEVIRVGATKGVTFELIDSVIERFTNEKREVVFHSIDDTLECLPSATSDVLRKLLNGAFIKSIKFPDSLKELRLLGLINNSRDNKWHIRNHLFDSYIRQHPGWTDTARSNNYVPRRLFVNVEGYKILFELENNLREFVVSQLFGAFGVDWERIVEGNSSLNKTISKWKGMKKENQGISWLTHDDLPSVCYGLFPDLKKIIDEYWGGMFDKFFKPRTIFDGSFEYLEELRNKIAHNRPLSDKDVDLLVSTAKQFNDCMYENN